MNLFKRFCFMSLLSLSFQIHAVDCHVTFVKDKCWKDYQVNLKIIDMSNQSNLLGVELAPGKMWDRKKIDCQPGKILNKSATYSPVIWEGDEKREFYGVSQISLPTVAPADGKVWAIDVCFPGDFAKVPSPPGDVTNCGCDKSNIPDIENSIRESK
jgi:hypothetical protein